MPTLQVPSSFSASLSVNPPETDIPAGGKLAEPIEPARNFANNAGNGSACGLITPDLINYLGTPIQFRVIVDADPNDPSVGKVADLTPLDGSGNSTYDSLAGCLLREWTFRTPSTDATVEASSSEVIVTVQIDPG